MCATSATELTRALIRFNTVNPGSTEAACARFVARMLEGSGIETELYEPERDRPHLAAWLPRRSEAPALCFCSHLDVAPLGVTRWRRDPFSGELADGLVHGRGASDAKSAAGAMLAAFLRLARERRLASSVMLLLTADEESGNRGIKALADSGKFTAKAKTLVVGEPTSCAPAVGHKGALWLACRAAGRTAHGSMPELGVNAVYKAAEAVLRIRDFDFGGISHPLMGSPTANVGYFAGGVSVNSVPDAAVFKIDIRTVHGQNHKELLADVAARLGPEISLETVLDAQPVFSDPAHPWIADAFESARAILGSRPEPFCLPYFTDASVLRDMMSAPPTIIFGPGEAAMAHKTDEYCEAEKIEQAAEFYFDMALKSCIKSGV